MIKPIIKFDQVSKIYSRSSVALKDINFEIQEGEFITIVGRSGVGKTTLINLLVGKERPTRGDVFFEGKIVNQMSARELSELRQKIGVVYQDYKLLPRQTAYQNVAYALIVVGASDQDINRDTPRVLDIVGLRDKKDNYPCELSGGEKQRLAIARALIHQPKLVVADEPSGNLDPYNTWEIIKIFKKINQLGTTVIVATHDKDVISQTEGRKIALRQGKIIRDEKDSKFTF
jgi:cell division transport system ATP-binding protein